MDVLRVLIVDLGGVLYNIDFIRTCKAFEALPGYNGTPVLFGVEDQDPLFVKVDRGDIANEEFYAQLRLKFGFTCPDADILTAWNAVLIEPFSFTPEHVALMKSNAERLVLLSNISEPHLAHCFPQSEHFLKHFDHLYLSCKMHMRKPDTDIFQAVLDAEGITASEAMFIDDSLKNCLAAESIGIRTMRVTEPSNIGEQLHGKLSALGFTSEE